MDYTTIQKEDFTVIDIEADGLDDATKMHVAVLRTGDNVEVYRDADKLKDRLRSVKAVAGHNVLGFDLGLLARLYGIVVDVPVLDTLVLSRLLNYNIKGGHSLEAWGTRLGIAKVGVEIDDWSEYTPLMEARCVSDTDINQRLLYRYERIWSNPEWQASLASEHFVARICKVMHDTGFPFNEEEAYHYRATLQQRIAVLDETFDKDFPPKTKLVGQYTPKLTKFGTFNRSNLRWCSDRELQSLDGGPFCRFEYVPFNPGSPRQIVERLNEAGWKPTDKTDGHADAIKAKPRAKKGSPEYAAWEARLADFQKWGWKVNDENLATLPESAPASAFKLAERITLASRLSDLDEWIAACSSTEGQEPAIHGHFQSIGAWTQRLSHQKPNTANIPQAKPSAKDTPFQKEIQTLNGKMRGLFRARKGYRLIGTDADGIQMRIFAHLCGDEKLIDSLVRGRKEDGTDIHSLNRQLLGSVCGSRDVAKTFIYAFLLGAGTGKVAEILGCSFGEAKIAVDQFITGLPGLKRLKQTRIPSEAAAGYFIGLDGRKVVCDSAHLMLAGHLQNGEKVIMAKALERWYSQLRADGIAFFLHNWVHDEWQTGVPDDDEICQHVQKVQCDALLWAGEQLGMSLPTPGSSDWGYTWQETH